MEKNDYDACADLKATEFIQSLGNNGVLESEAKWLREHGFMYKGNARANMLVPSFIRPETPLLNQKTCLEMSKYGYGTKEAMVESIENVEKYHLTYGEPFWRCGFDISNDFNFQSWAQGFENNIPKYPYYVFFNRKIDDILTCPRYYAFKRELEEHIKDFHVFGMTPDAALTNFHMKLQEYMEKLQEALKNKPKEYWTEHCF